jgi:hypothetical protein
MSSEKSVKDTLQTGNYFATPIYFIEKPDFVSTVLPVFDEYVKNSLEVSPVNELYPSVMTGNMVFDPRLQEFTQYLVGTAWNIMKAQGYDMDNKITYFHSMWGQQYYKYGNMEQHIHNDGVQIVGFYFLECPEKCPRMIVHDPRERKQQNALSEADHSKVTDATSAIVFDGKPGSLFFTNSWLPHSFTRNGSDNPFKFIHFNISVKVSDIQQKKAIVI